MHTMAILARHTATFLGDLGLVQGSLDPPIDDGGRNEALDLAAALGSLVPPDTMLLCSPQSRARGTAATLREQLGLGPAILVPEFREMDFGDWQGRPEEELLSDPACGAAYREMWPDFVWGHGETLRSRSLEAETALQHIASSSASSGHLIVSHGYLLQGLISELLRGDPSHAGDYFLKRGAFMQVTCDFTSAEAPPIWELAL